MWNTNKVVNTSGLVSETRPSCWAQEIKEVMLNSSSHEEKRDQGGGRVGAGSSRGAASASGAHARHHRAGGPKDRASRKLLLSRRLLGTGLGTDEQSRTQPLATGLTPGCRRRGECRTKPVAASRGGGDGAGWATSEHPEQSHGSNEMGGRRWFPFVPLRIMVSLKPYSTQRVRKQGEQRCGCVWETLLIEEGKKKGKKIQKIMEAKALQTI